MYLKIFFGREYLKILYVFVLGMQSQKLGIVDEQIFKQFS